MLDFAFIHVYNIKKNQNNHAISVSFKPLPPVSLPNNLKGYFEMHLIIHVHVLKISWSYRPPWKNGTACIVSWGSACISETKLSKKELLIDNIHVHKNVTETFGGKNYYLNCLIQNQSSIHLVGLQFCFYSILNNLMQLVAD